MSRRFSRWLVFIAALSGLLAVAAAAAGAHALPADAGARELRWFGKANDYHMTHTLALLGIGLWARWQPGGRAPAIAAGAMLAGMALFCGSLYAMALGADPRLAGLTPIGGLSFMLGWGLLAWSARPGAGSPGRD